MGLRNIDLKEEYRSDRNDIVAEFFIPCLSGCTEYCRCVDFLSVHSLTAIAMGFENFASGRARLRIVTGHRFRTQDLMMLTKLFSARQAGAFDGRLIKDSKMRKLYDIVGKGQIEVKIAVPNSEHVAESFSERIGIFLGEDGEAVAFTGTSKESFSTQTKDFESVDVFTSWNDQSRVETKRNDFENLWADRTKYVDVYDFATAQKNNLLKISTDWAVNV